MGALIGFAPWIAFWTISGFGTFEQGTLAGLIAAVVVTAPDLLRRDVKILDAGTLVAFVLLALLGLTRLGGTFSVYAAPLSNALITAIVVVSLLLRQPFVLQYAREGRPRETWNEPHFVRACYIITWVWLAAFMVQTLSSLLAVWVPRDQVVLAYIVPYGALLGAVVFTRWYPAHLQERAARAARSSSGGSSRLR
jgi:hypothetical protein